MSEQKRILPADVARCSAVWGGDYWASECVTCRRRTDPGREAGQEYMNPPRDFWDMQDGCIYQIQDDGGDQK